MGLSAGRRRGLAHVHPGHGRENVRGRDRVLRVRLQRDRDRVSISLLARVQNLTRI